MNPLGAGGRTSVTQALARAHRPHGHRLGILVVPGVPAAALAAAADAIEAHGSRPARRLAQIQPAPGSADVTAEEAAWFLERFGHEYTSVLWAAGRPGTETVRAAAAAQGVTFIEV